MFKDIKNIIIGILTLLLIVFIFLYKNNSTPDKYKDEYDKLHHQNDSLELANKLYKEEINSLHSQNDKIVNRIDSIANLINNNSKSITDLKNKITNEKNFYRNANVDELNSFFTKFFNTYTK